MRGMSRYLALTLLEDDRWLAGLLHDIKDLGGSITVDEYCSGGCVTVDGCCVGGLFSHAEISEFVSRLRSLGLVSHGDDGFVALTSWGRSIADQRANEWAADEGRLYSIRRRVLQYFDVGAHTSRHVHKYCQWAPGDGEPTHEEVAQVFAWLARKGFIAAENRGDMWLGFARLPEVDAALLSPEWRYLDMEVEKDTDPCERPETATDATGLDAVRDHLDQALIILDQLPLHEREGIRVRGGAVRNVGGSQRVPRGVLRAIVDGVLSRVRHRK